MSGAPDLPWHAYSPTHFVRHDRREGIFQFTSVYLDPDGAWCIQLYRAALAGATATSIRNIGFGTTMSADTVKHIAADLVETSLWGIP